MEKLFLLLHMKHLRNFRKTTNFQCLTEEFLFCCEFEGQVWCWNLNGIHQAENLDHLGEINLPGAILVIHTERPPGDQLSRKMYFGLK